jgi:hypothetical protein
MRARAKIKVRSYRDISPEADALSRELQAQLNISANELAEKAIYALAEAHKRRRTKDLARAV